ncbi:MAG: hypothetical protein RIR91_1195, partial [Verrucomicrobiota bacterium]
YAERAATGKLAEEDPVPAKKGKKNAK